MKLRIITTSSKKKRRPDELPQFRIIADGESGGIVECSIAQECLDGRWDVRGGAGPSVVAQSRGCLAGAASRIAELNTKIDDLQAKKDTAQKDADRYSGGLVLAMKLSAIATMAQTEAMLDQRRLALEYGLPQYVGFEALTASASPVVEPEEPTESLWEITYDLGPRA